MFFFSTSSQIGAMRNVIAYLIGPCDYWVLKTFFFFFFFLLKSSRLVWGDDEKHVGRDRHPRLHLASVVVYLRVCTGQGAGDTLEFLFCCRIKISRPFIKDFRGGATFVSAICIFGDSAHSRATRNVKSRVNLTVTNKQWKDMQMSHFLYLQPLQSTRHAFIFI